MNQIDSALTKRYYELYTIQKHDLLTEAETEELIEVSTKILAEILRTEYAKEILIRLRNR